MFLLRPRPSTLCAAIRWVFSNSHSSKATSHESCRLARGVGHCTYYGDRVRNISANRSLVGRFILQPELKDICAESLWDRSICATRGDVDCMGVHSAGHR